MPHYRFTKSPRALNSRKVKLDNVALVPASILPFKDQWQSLANELPDGSILVCVPLKDNKPRQPYLAVARTLRDKGFKVRAVNAQNFPLANNKQ